MTVMQLQGHFQLTTKGRPPRAGGPTEIDKERGRRIGDWLRGGMMPPHQIIELKKSDVAKIIGMSSSMVGYYVADCYDATEDRMKFPSPEAIAKIAQKLNISEKEGMSARFWKPRSTQPTTQEIEYANDLSPLIERLQELTSTEAQALVRQQWEMSLSAAERMSGTNAKGHGNDTRYSEEQKREDAKHARIVPLGDSEDDDE